MLTTKHSESVFGGSRFHISGGFGILLAVLLFLDEHNIVPWAMLACFLHELGHLLAIYLLGGRMQSFRLTVIGAEIVPARKKMFSYREELLIAGAGPLMSFAGAILGASCAQEYRGNDSILLFSGLNLAAGLFNLLPVGPLDGGRLLSIMLLRRYSLHKAEQIYLYISFFFSVAILYLGIFHMVRLGGNITLLLTGIWLLTGVRRNHT